MWSSCRFCLEPAQDPNKRAKRRSHANAAVASLRSKRMRARLACSAALLLVLALSGCTFSMSLNQPPAPPAAAGAEQRAGAEQADRSGQTNPLDTIPYAEETEFALATIVQYLAFFAELCGALVIAVAVVRGI